MLTLTQSSSHIQVQPPLQHPYRHIAALGIFFLLSLLLYILLSLIAPPFGQPVGVFDSVWAACFLVYFVASFWVIRTRPLAGRWLWCELGIVFLGAIIFRVMLIHLPADLSNDAWRYLFDGKMIVHGYSPYQYAPNSPVLAGLRDSAFARANYLTLPTKYPPGAELFYVLGYLLSPNTLFGLKSLFVLCDLVTCVAVALLLRAWGRDMRYALLYAWSPLPIVEFAAQSHIDAVVVASTVLAILCAASSWRYARVFAGIFIGLATLTKLYPLVLLILILRRRDWPLLIACGTTIVAGYLPFFLMSHGYLLTNSPLSAIVGQSEDHLGVLQMVIYDLGRYFRLSIPLIHAIILLFELPIAAITLLFVIVQRRRGRLSVESGILLLTWVILSDYAHIFPWYAVALLPWVALCLSSLPGRKILTPRGIAILSVWYFTVACILSYLPVGYASTEANWLLYYAASFGVVLLGLLVAAILYLRSRTQPSL